MAPPGTTFITTSAGLVAAVSAGSPGQQIWIGAGTFELSSPIFLKPGMQLIGSGASTIITGVASWAPGFADVSVGGTESFDAYLIKQVAVNGAIGNNVISQITFRGPDLHGAIHTNNTFNLTVERCRFEDFGWSAMRLVLQKKLFVSECEFFNAGKRRQFMGAGIKGDFITEAYIVNCSFTTDATVSADQHVGFKSEGARSILIEWCEFILPGGFDIEVPFQISDRENVVRNCLLNDAVSIPKFEGSKVLAKNWVRDLDGSVTWDGLLSWRFTYCRWETSFCIEFNRNSLEVGFCVAVSNRPEVNGNFIAEFSSVFAAGPALIHDCMIEGKRGIYGTSGGMKNIAFINNHFRSVSDSLTNAFFGFKNIPDILTTVQVKNNIFDGTAVSKPLYSSTIADANVQTANNTLINVPTGAANSPTGDPIGPARNLRFRLGIRGRYLNDNWERRIA